MRLRGDDAPAHGRAIRAAREARRMKQAALAAEIGVTQSQVSRFENGDTLPSRTQAERIAAAVGRSVADLFG